MMERKKYRHELKYPISFADYLIIRNRISKVMMSDPHAMRDGTYRIRSVYFDNADDKALREKEEGLALREKFRIRYYNDDKSFITLEKKMKAGSLCIKYDAGITKEEYRKILEGDTGWMKYHPSDIVRELYAKMTFQGLRPRVLVSYLREPYIYPPGNVRVTFDSEIRTSLIADDLLSDTVNDISATDMPTDRLIEVKYDEYLPEIIQKLIQVRDVRQESFSKYGTCRRYF